MILVKIVNTFIVNMGKDFVILLRETGDGKRTLPISIGQLEAQSIALQLNKIPFPRPLTHDLLKNIIDKLDGKVVRAEIYALKDNTFFASLILQIGETTLSVEARPSDAIAMSLRFDAPVFVDEGVMDNAGVILPETETDEIISNSETEPIAENVAQSNEYTQVEALRKALKNAIAKERYEDAARIRDEINKLTKSN